MVRLRRVVPSVALAACLGGCVEVDLTDHEQAVIGGRLTADGAMPGVGALMYDFGGGQPQTGCTGTLIAPDVVLTAAHCVSPALTGGVVPGFTLDHDTVSAPPTVVPGLRAVPHELFDYNVEVQPGLHQYYDIGLVFLAQPITTVAPVRMPRPPEAMALTADLDLVIAGYGRTSNDSFESGVMYDATTKLVSLNETELQVSMGQGQPQNCHGDSGGPALADLGFGTRLVGTVSRSFDATGECLNGGVDTRVDAYLDWIHAQATAQGVTIPCSSGLSPPCPGDDTDDGGGCCSTSSGGSRGAPAALLLAGLVGALLSRRRR